MGNSIIKWLIREVEEEHTIKATLEDGSSHEEVKNGMFYVLFILKHDHDFSAVGS